MVGPNCSHDHPVVLNQLQQFSLLRRWTKSEQPRVVARLNEKNARPGHSSNHTSAVAGTRSLIDEQHPNCCRRHCPHQRPLSGLDPRHAAAHPGAPEIGDDFPVAFAVATMLQDAINGTFSRDVELRDSEREASFAHSTKPSDKRRSAKSRTRSVMDSSKKPD